jgi:hypothetical protein
MKYKLEINEGLLNRIISVAYGDANLFEKFRIYFLAIRNSEVKRLLAEYKSTAQAVQTLNQDECPLNIIENIKMNTGIEKEDFLESTSRFFYVLFYKPVITIAAIMVLVFGITFFLFLNKTSKTQYSQIQIQLAEKQVKQSLVLVNRIFNRTADKVENDILKEQVAKPVHEGISTINNLFNGG